MPALPAASRLSSDRPMADSFGTKGLLWSFGEVSYLLQQSDTFDTTISRYIINTIIIMNKTDLSLICRQTRELARDTGQFILKESKKFPLESIKTKGIHDFVTYVDKGSEKKLVEGLKRILPGSGFVAEEGTYEKCRGKYIWIIDPLDGTTNFIHGLPTYSISIALLENQEIVLGVVLEISLDECFYSWKGDKAYMNDVEISVTETKTVKESLIATGFPFTNYIRLDPFLNSLKHFMKNSHGIRRIGSAAVDLAYLACGRFDAFYEYNLNPWDVAAGAFIIKQAGGKVSDFSGGNNYLYGKEIVAANSYVFDEFLATVKNFMIS
jgi:myo-inositol-1(or 4)-monophosphatase